MRVFPFSFPPIRGGAQGGASPTPTPDPEPETPLYDLTNASLVMTQYPGATDWISTPSDANFKWSLSGIVVNDSSGVSSVKIDFKTLDWTAAGNAVASSDLSHGEISVDKDNPAKTNANGFVRYKDGSLTNDAIGVSGDATFTAYDSNGEILQQDTITVVGF